MTSPCSVLSRQRCHRKSAGSEMVSTAKRVRTHQRVDQFRHKYCHYVHCLGIQLYPSSTVEIKTTDHVTSITLKAAHKEHEGFYSVRLKTWNEVEHSAYIYVKGKMEILTNIRSSLLLIIFFIMLYSVCNHTGSRFHPYIPHWLFVLHDFIFCTIVPKNCKALKH